MQSVKGAVHNAENRITGRGQEHVGEEPVSGVKGSGTGTDPYDAGNATDQPGNPVEGHSESSSANLDRHTSDPRAGGKSEPKSPEKATNSEQTKTLGGPPGNTTENAGSAKKDLNDSLKKEASPSPAENDLDPAGVPGNTKTLSHEETHDPPPGSSGSSSKDKTDAASESGSSRQSSDKGSDEQHEATGTKHQKSTGFAAQGGNFDAKAPGAGKEAGRLLEEQGADLRAPSNSADENAGGGHHGGLWKGTHKSGLTMGKAKEKLHIGKQQS